MHFLHFLPNPQISFLITVVVQLLYPPPAVPPVREFFSHINFQTPGYVSEKLLSDCGGILFLTYFGKVSISGEVGGYPQALLKVVNLQGTLDFHRNFVLVKNPSPCLSVNN